MNAKYQAILDSMMTSIEKRDNLSRKEVTARYEDAAQAGMHREAILYILADQTFRRRIAFFCLYPELIIPYFFRVKVEKKHDPSP